MSQSHDWEQFCDRAAKVLRNTLENNIELKEASDFFENDHSIKDKDLRRYIESMVWEIDGSRDSFIELLELLEAHASEAALIEYLDS